MLRYRGDFNRAPNGLGLLLDRKFGKAHRDFYQISCKINCVLDWHGWDGQSPKRPLPDGRSQTIGVRLLHPPIHQNLLQIGRSSKNETVQSIILPIPIDSEAAFGMNT